VANHGFNQYVLVKEISRHGRVPISEHLAPPGVRPGWVDKTIAQLGQKGLLSVEDGQCEVTEAGERAVARMERILARIENDGL
jgi:hypothetical protein